jgi:hypothetical protein
MIVADSVPVSEPAPKKWKVGGVKGMPELVIDAADEKTAAERYVEKLRLSRNARPTVKPASNLE